MRERATISDVVKFPMPTIYRDDRPPVSLADRIARIGRAIKAKELAAILMVDKVTIYNHAAAGRIPSFHIGTAVRFDPVAVAKWLRTQ